MPDRKRQSRGISNDMSAEAIARRLDIASQLYKLARTLSNARYVGRVEQARGPSSKRRER